MLHGRCKALCDADTSCNVIEARARAIPPRHRRTANSTVARQQEQQQQQQRQQEQEQEKQ